MATKPALRVYYPTRRAPGQATSRSTLREGPNEFTLLDATGADFFGVADWYQVLDLAQPAGAVPYGISHIEFTAGSRDGDRVPTLLPGQGDGYWLTHDRYILFEFYDTHLCDIPDNSGTCTPIGSKNAVHQGYLGGVLFNLGPHGGLHGEEDYGSWIGDAGSNGEIFTLYAPTDGRISFYARMGELIGGVFSPADTDPDDSGLSVVFSTDGSGGFYTIGSGVYGSRYLDGFDGATDGFDRVLTTGDGPLVFDFEVPVLDLLLRGRPLDDCNDSGVPDVFEIACAASPDADTSDCAPGQCTWFQDTDTSGLFESAAWANPLSADATELLCVTAGADDNGNGFIDSCECEDCNANGQLDICDVDCDIPIFACPGFPGGTLCSTLYPGTCGQSSDCNGNIVPDECEVGDCNGNDILDSCELAAGSATDCDGNGTLDVCDIADCVAPDPSCADCDENGVLDACERPIFFDCNRNGSEDHCDIIRGLSNDMNGDDQPDECEGKRCRDVWGGFEAAVFGLSAGDPVDDYDSDGNGDAWSSTGQGTIENYGDCPPGNLAFVEQFATGPGVHFTNSELLLSDSAGNVPQPAKSISVTFDWQMIEAIPNPTGYDLRSGIRDGRMYLVGAQGNATVAILGWSNTESTIEINPPVNTNSVPPQHLLVLDAELGWVDTGLQWSGTTCYRTTVSFEQETGRVEVLYSTDGGAHFTSGYIGSALDPNARRIDYFQVTSVDNGVATGAEYSVTQISFDNFKVCELGGQMNCDEFIGPDGTESSDCDDDGICDLFQLNDTDADRNDNDVLDRCEGLCGDCNHNAIPDDYEIAQTPTLDMDANGVIDFCETFVDTISTGFESYSPGALNGQQGWYELDADVDPRGVTTVTSADAGVAGWPTGSQYIRLEDANTNSSNFVTLLLSPRVSGQDGEVERWSWDQVITAGGYGSMWVEVADDCEDQPAAYVGTTERIDPDPYFNLADTSLPSVVANAGLEFRAHDEAPGNRDRLFARLVDGIYEWPEDASTAQRDLTTRYGNATSAAIEIYNGRGQWKGFYGTYGNPELITDMSGGPFFFDETQETYFPSDTCPTVEFHRGGDSELIIRTSGDFGHPSVSFLYDNISYETFSDCDLNGVIDAVWLASADPDNGGQPFSVRFDKNGDGIPDLCQDCNNDCTNLPAGGHNPACLDPNQLGADANNNGIPDACDVNTDLPYVALYDYPGPQGGCSCLTDPGTPIDYKCFITRRGGGSCDANTDGVPDEAEAGFTDCNNNGCNDINEIDYLGLPDANINGIPDVCDADCNHNGIPDFVDKGVGISQDNFPNFPLGDGILDECCLGTPSPDLDGDGDVDLDDYSFLIHCVGVVAGAAQTVPPGDCIRCECGCADFNSDGIVDPTDVAVFKQFVTGPN